MRNPSEDKNGGDSAALVRDLRHGSWTAQVEEMLRRAADRIEELERQCARFELAACCPDERACEKASASSSLGGTVDKSGEYDADVFDSGRDSMADDVLDILNVYRDQFNEDERIEKVRALCREQLVSAPHKDQPEGK